MGRKWQLELKLRNNETLWLDYPNLTTLKEKLKIIESITSPIKQYTIFRNNKEYLRKDIKI